MNIDVFPMDSDPLPQMASNSTCNVVVFLELHDQKHPVQDIKSLLPFFKTKGFNTFCFETSKSKENFYSEVKKHVKTGADWIKNEIDALDLYFLGKEMDPRISTSITKLKERQAAIQMHYEAEMEILVFLDRLSIKYCAMDAVYDLEPAPATQAEFDKANRKIRLRDRHMSNMIKKSCDDGHVLILVGQGHYMGIHRNLSHDVNIKGYHTPSWLYEIETEFDKYFPENKYLREVRFSSDQDYHVNKATNITVIDLYKNPDYEHNISDIIRQDYENYLVEQNSAQADHGEL